MEQLFLEELEAGAGSGPYAELIKGMRAAGAAIPQMFYLFAFKSEATDHLCRFAQAVMRGPSPLSPGMRELIAAFTSSLNHCHY